LVFVNVKRHIICFAFLFSTLLISPRFNQFVTQELQLIDLQGEKNGHLKYIILVFLVISGVNYHYSADFLIISTAQAFSQLLIKTG